MGSDEVQCQIPCTNQDQGVAIGSEEEFGGQAGDGSGIEGEKGGINGGERLAIGEAEEGVCSLNIGQVARGVFGGSG